MVNAIRDDERVVLTMSNHTTEVEGYEGVSLSLPRVLGAAGVLTTLRPMLCDEELVALQRSSQILRDVVSELKY
jgi:L-lactate dehydrogenase